MKCLATHHLVLMAWLCQGTNAFSPRSVIHPSFKTSYQLSPSPLFSSIEDDEERLESKNKVEIRPPEDLLTLGGDVLAIFLYTYMDHEATWLYDVFSKSHHSILPFSQEMNNRVPVWFNTFSVEPFGSIPLNIALPVEHHFLYTPALAEPGIASVLFVTLWVTTSILTEALNFKNTQSDSQTALLMTTYTWIIAAIQIAFVAWLSDGVIGHMDAFHKSIGLTHGDMEYLCGSLTVLLIWRFIVSVVLGSGNDTSSK